MWDLARRLVVSPFPLALISSGNVSLYPLFRVSDILPIFYSDFKRFAMKQYPLVFRHEKSTSVFQDEHFKIYRLLLKYVLLYVCRNIVWSSPPCCCLCSVASLLRRGTICLYIKNFLIRSKVNREAIKKRGCSMHPFTFH